MSSSSDRIANIFAGIGAYPVPTEWHAISPDAPEILLESPPCVAWSITDARVVAAARRTRPLSEAAVNRIADGTKRLLRAHMGGR